jgi:hypothetical protein
MHSSTLLKACCYAFARKGQRRVIPLSPKPLMIGYIGACIYYQFGLHFASPFSFFIDLFNKLVLSVEKRIPKQ